MLEEKRTEFRVTTQEESKEENPRKDVGGTPNSVYKLNLNLLPTPERLSVLHNLQTAHLTLKKLNLEFKFSLVDLQKTKQNHQYSLEEQYSTSSLYCSNYNVYDIIRRD